MPGTILSCRVVMSRYHPKARGVAGGAICDSRSCERRFTELTEQRWVELPGEVIIRDVKEPEFAESSREIAREPPEQLVF